MTAAVSIRLTEHALLDIEMIYQQSIQRWGKRVAEKYLNEIESALARIKSSPGLLQQDASFPPFLKFYPVHRHLFVCDVRDRSIVVLTLLHGSMDIPSRLAELQPNLMLEIELLHRGMTKR